MDVAVAGGHGKIALRLLRLLSQRGDRGLGLIRNPDHASDLEAVGAMPVGVDLENLDPDAIATSITGCDAVVFAAGAGPGSGPERKRTVDLGGAVRLIEACEAKGISRYVMVSSIGAHDPAGGPEQMRTYLEAKAGADEALEKSGLEATIVRPGSLSDDPGTGKVEISTEMGRRGPVSREDVAAVLAEVLAADNAIGKTFELFEGETPIADAVRAL
jgi:uncharacterized protein YbjT (DUF2867 family)